MMATYAAYRHVELDKVGCGKKRVVKPPGGDCHDVFGTDFSGSLPSNPHHRITKPPGGETNEIFTTPNSTPPSTPRKVKNYMASNIFTPDGQSNEARAIRHRPDDDSFKRLFGANGGGGDNPDGSPRKNHQKSSIVFADAGPANGKVNGTNGTNGHSNGHGVNGTNGTNGHSNGHENGTPNGNSNGIANGGSNGHVNGSNGHGHVNGGSNGTNGHTNGTNGHANGTNGHANGDSPKMNGSNGVHAEANGKRIPPGGYASKLW